MHEYGDAYLCVFVVDTGMRYIDDRNVKCTYKCNRGMHKPSIGSSRLHYNLPHQWEHAVKTSDGFEVRIGQIRSRLMDLRLNAVSG